jgi:chromate transporter
MTVGSDAPSGLVTPAAAPSPAAGGAEAAAAWVLVALLGALIAVTVLRVRPAAGSGARPSRLQMFREALVLGLVGFGGGIAVLAQIENRIVARRGWASLEQYLEAAALAQSVPGAVAVNALAFLGLWLAGVPAALTLVTGFILPSFVLLLAGALVYPHLQHFSALGGLFRYLTPAAAGLIAATALRLAARGALHTPSERTGWTGRLARAWGVALALAAFLGVAFLGLGVVETIVIAGLIGVARTLPARSGSNGEAKAIVAWVPAGVAAVRGVLLVKLAGVFLRAGALTFGGGFVMIPLLETELVHNHHWLTDRTFADAMALGQVTPGPVVMSATFIGYTIAGLAGALLATAAVFLPAGLMIWLIATQVERFRASVPLQGFLRGVQPAVVGLMLAAAVAIARGGVTGWPQAAVALIALVAVGSGRVAPMWIMLSAAALGIAEAALRAPV